MSAGGKLFGMGIGLGAAYLAYEWASDPHSTFNRTTASVPHHVKLKRKGSVAEAADALAEPILSRESSEFEVRPAPPHLFRIALFFSHLLASL